MMLRRTALSSPTTPWPHHHVFTWWWTAGHAQRSRAREAGPAGTDTLEGVRIDLHTHSTASDGTDTPAELVRNAAAAGLDVVAITDHDTTAGWAEAVDARPDGLTL
ncbi:PHP domain-containing protein, partial [Nocardia farcinica]|uniref:PHP domain-containing protein n=1 Tax=Nocardia farcinica TaxID=37329 RepID=UPI003F68A4AA